MLSNINTPRFSLTYILLSILLVSCSGTNYREEEPDAFILPVFDRCPDPQYETQDGIRLIRPPTRNLEFHRGCRKRYTEKHCAIRIIEYGELAHGVVCGIRPDSK